MKSTDEERLNEFVSQLDSDGVGFVIVAIRRRIKRLLAELGSANGTQQKPNRDPNHVTAESKSACGGPA